MIKNDGQITAPIRLCYYRLCHYNSMVDPFKPTIGVGLDLPGYSPGSADRNQMKQAVKNSDSDLVERTMLEDKIRATGKKCVIEKSRIVNYRIIKLLCFYAIKAYVMQWSLIL